MGADLTIAKDPNEETGYFRDSYNVTNILNRLGLSYWQIELNIPALGKVGYNMKPEQVVILRNEVIWRKPVLDKFLAEELNEAWLKENFASLEDEGIEGWRKFYAEKYEKFVKFLNHAVELKSGIKWSV